MCFDISSPIMLAAVRPVKRNRCAILSGVPMRSRRVALAVLFVLLVSLTAVAVARRAADAPSSSDTAVIESYTLLAGRGALLVGAYSRFQWHHPGPLYFYLLAPFYAAAGWKAAGLNAGAATLAVASVALVGAILLRRRPRLAVLTMAALALFAWRAAEATASPWHPHVAVLPLTGSIGAAAAVIAGAYGLLPLVAFLASLAGQAHVALMPCVLIVGAMAATRVIVSATDHNRGDRARRALVLTAIVLALSWALPLYEQLSASPRGNVTELWQFFIRQPHRGQPFGVALSAWADMLVGIVRPDFYPAHGWPFVESPVRWAEALSLAAVAAVAVRGWLAFRKGDTFLTAFASLLVASAAVALWSATRIDERIFDHDVFWIAGIGLLMLAALVDSLLALVSAWEPGRRAAGLIAIALLAVAAAASASHLEQVVSQSFDPPAEARLAGELAADLRAYMTREGVARPLIRIDQDAWPVAAGAILALQKEGRMTAVEEDWVVMFSPAFRANGHEDAIVTVAAPAEHLRLRDAGVTEISAHEPIYAHAVRVSGP
jgi:hypothetical protein